MSRHSAPEKSPIVTVIGMLCATAVLVTMALTGGSKDVGAVLAAATLVLGYMIVVRLFGHRQ